MWRFRLNPILALAVGITVTASGFGQETILGKDLGYMNSQAGSTVKGNAVEVWSNANHGCHIGFNIPKSYRGKSVKITARIKILAGKAQCMIEKFGVWSQQESEYCGPGEERDIVLECRCPGGDDLYAVVSLDRASRATILYIKIE